MDLLTLTHLPRALYRNDTALYLVIYQFVFLRLFRHAGHVAASFDHRGTAPENDRDRYKS